MRACRAWALPHATAAPGAARAQGSSTGTMPLAARLGGAWQLGIARSCMARVADALDGVRHVGSVFLLRIA